MPTRRFPLDQRFGEGATRNRQPVARDQDAPDAVAAQDAPAKEGAEDPLAPALDELRQGALVEWQDGIETPGEVHAVEAVAGDCVVEEVPVAAELPDASDHSSEC